MSDCEPDVDPRPLPPGGGKVLRRTMRVPEIGLSELTASNLRTQMERRGCLLVRGFTPEDTALRLRREIDRAFERFDSGALTFYEFPDGEPPRDFIRALDGVLALDAPQAAAAVFTAFEEAGLPALLRDFFEDDSVLLGSKFTLRRVRPRDEREFPPTAVDFHQDGSFMSTDVKTLNVWLALSHCGVDAPGLDVVPRRLDEIAAMGVEGARLHWTVSRTTTKRLGNAVTPVFAPGDALLFDHMLLHRTGLAPGMTRERHAIEAWFGAGASYPQGLCAVPY